MKKKAWSFVAALAAGAVLSWGQPQPDKNVGGDRSPDRITAASALSADGLHFVAGHPAAQRIDSGLAPAGSFDVRLSSDPRTFSRAVLVYELARLAHWSAAPRSVNGGGAAPPFGESPAWPRGE